MNEGEANRARIREAAKAASALKRNLAKLAPLLSGAFQKGFEMGYLNARSEAYLEQRGQEPPVSMVDEWQKRATRKASGG